MPSSPPKICAYPGCGVKVYGGTRCKKHNKQLVRGPRSKEAERNRKMYDSRRWRKRRYLYLLANPLCVHCLEKGELTEANVVDHIKPHKGNIRLFWDENNWQALCTPCHGRKTVLYDGGFGNDVR